MIFGEINKQTKYKKQHCGVLTVVASQFFSSLSHAFSPSRFINTSHYTAQIAVYVRCRLRFGSIGHMQKDQTVAMEEHSVITLSWGQKNTPILENRQHLGRTECFSIEGESSSSSSSSSTDLRLHICPGFVTSLCSPAPQGSKKKEREFHSSKEKEVVGLGDSFNSLVCFLSLEGVWTLADCQPG